MQACCQPLDPVAQLTMGKDNVSACAHGRAIRAFQCIAFDPVGKIHGEIRFL
jgi:hypothetical protein